MAILAFFERRNCQSPSSEIVFRHLLAFDLPRSRAAGDLRCILWGRHRTALCTFFLALRSLLFSSRTSVVSVKLKQAEFILPVCPTVLCVVVCETYREAYRINSDPAIPTLTLSGWFLIFGWYSN